MLDFIRTINHFITAVSLLLGITSTTVFAGTLGPIKNSNWYLGAAVSALWADLPSSITINNGAASPSLRAMESRRRGRVVPGSLRAGCFSAGKI